MELVEASELHLNQLMTWFSSDEDCTRWGGPGFRFPFDEIRFQEDLRWQEFYSLALVTATGQMVAFGQLYEKYNRMHLARLVVHPAQRRKGYGRMLIEKMLVVGPSLIEQDTYSLNVYADNEAAISCYHQLGFEVIPSPEQDPRFATCLFMVLKPE